MENTVSNIAFHPTIHSTESCCEIHFTTISAIAQQKLENLFTFHRRSPLLTSRGKNDSKTIAKDWKAFRGKNPVSKKDSALGNPRSRGGELFHFYRLRPQALMGMFPNLF